MTPMKKVPAANMQVVDTRVGPPGTALKLPVLSRRQEMKRQMLMRNPAAMAKANAAAEIKRTTADASKIKPVKSDLPLGTRSGEEAKKKGIGVWLAKGGAVKKAAKKKTAVKKKK